MSEKENPDKLFSLTTIQSIKHEKQLIKKKKKT